MLTPPRKKPRRTSSRKLTKREHLLLRRISAMLETLGKREEPTSEAGVVFRDGAHLLSELAAWGRIQRVVAQPANGAAHRADASAAPDPRTPRPSA
ncbi:MAG TPA: hypothetical protein VNJ51_07815 [Candidatus Dormibacteraeota bacterium]|nr:hypothetical protein [Candidatus Dormibacteraeota bacterium]